MNDIEKAIEDWKKGIGDIPTNSSNDTYKSNLLHERWSPKWQWFQPPMWRIFSWAYNIKSVVYTGVYPIAVKTDMEIPPEGITLEFQASIYKSEAIEEKAKELFNQFKSKFEYLGIGGMCGNCSIYEFRKDCIHESYCLRAYNIGYKDGAFDKNKLIKDSKEGE